MSDHATMHQLSDLLGSLSRITGEWGCSPNGDAVLRAIGLPSLQPSVDRVHQIIAEMKQLKQEDDGA